MKPEFIFDLNSSGAELRLMDVTYYFDCDNRTRLEETRNNIKELVARYDGNPGALFADLGGLGAHLVTATPVRGRLRSPSYFELASFRPSTPV